MNGQCDIEIEAAQRSDAPFVAWTVLTALDINPDGRDDMVRCCADDQSMYSWRNALLAKVEGVTVGCIISYDGADYVRMREYTWSRLWGDSSIDEIRGVALETEAGEYYLDSLAVVPECRGCNIGRALIEGAMQMAGVRGYNRFGLIADINKPHLLDYYKSIGFREFDEIIFFGHTYKRLKCRK